MTPASSPGIQLRLDIETPEAIIGGSLRVRVTVHNASAAGMFADAPDSASPFVYRLTDPANGRTFMLSKAAYLQRTLIAPLPPAEPRLAPLPPGGEIHREEDLAGYMTNPVPAGDWEIAVSYAFRGAVYQSEKARVKIVPPRVEAMEVVPNGDGSRLATVILHRDHAGKLVVFQREDGGSTPVAGAFYPRHTLAAASGGIAITTHAEGTAEQRWLAWTDGGQLRISQVWGAAQMNISPPVAIPAEARLLSPGWSFDERPTMFTFAHTGKLGIAALPEGAAPLIREFDFAGGSSRWLAAGLYHHETELRFLLAWIESHAGGSRLISQAFSPATKLFEPPVTLADTPLTPVALSVDAVAREGTPRVCALFAPANGARGEASAIIARHGVPTATVSIPLPEAPVVEWSIAANETSVVVGAVTASQVLVWHGNGWRTVAEGAVRPHFLRVVHALQTWVVWADADHGVIFKAIP